MLPSKKKGHELKTTPTRVFWKAWHSRCEILCNSALGNKRLINSVQTKKRRSVVRVEKYNVCKCDLRKKQLFYHSSIWTFKVWNMSKAVKKIKWIGFLTCHPNSPPILFKIASYLWMTLVFSCELHVFFVISGFSYLASRKYLNRKKGQHWVNSSLHSWSLYFSSNITPYYSCDSQELGFILSGCKICFQQEMFSLRCINKYK